MAENINEIFLGTEYAGNKEKFKSLKAYYEWYKTVPREKVEDRVQPAFRVPGFSTETFRDTMRENGWKAASDEELIDAIDNAFYEFQAPHYREGTAPELECLFTDLMYFKVESYEDRETFLNLFKEAIHTVKDAQYDHDEKATRLLSAIEKAEKNVRSQEDFELAKQKYEEDEATKEEAEEVRFRNFKGRYSEHRPVSSYDEDSFMWSARNIGMRSLTENSLLRKLYRAAIKEGADTELECIMMPIRWTTRTNPEHLDNTQRDYRMSLREVVDYLYRRGFDKKPGYAEFLKEAKPYLDAHKEADARWINRQGIYNTHELDLWYRYGGPHKSLDPLFTGEDGLKNFVEQTRELGWYRKGDTELMTRFYTVAMSMQGDIGDRAKMVLENLTSTYIGNDDKIRGRLLRAMEYTLKLGVESSSYYRRAARGRNHSIEMPLSGGKCVTDNDYYDLTGILDEAKQAEKTQRPKELKDRYGLLKESELKNQLALAKDKDKLSKETRKEKRRYLSLSKEGEVAKHLQEIPSEVRDRLRRDFRFKSFTDFTIWATGQEGLPYDFPEELAGENGTKIFLDKMAKNGWKSEDMNLLEKSFTVLRDFAPEDTSMRTYCRQVLAGMMATPLENEDMRNEFLHLVSDTIFVHCNLYGTGCLQDDFDFLDGCGDVDDYDAASDLISELDEAYRDTAWEREDYYGNKPFKIYESAVKKEKEDFLKIVNQEKLAENKHQNLEDKQQEISRNEKIGELITETKAERINEKKKVQELEERILKDLTTGILKPAEKAEEKPDQTLSEEEKIRSEQAKLESESKKLAENQKKAKEEAEKFAEEQKKAEEEANKLKEEKAKEEEERKLQEKMRIELEKRRLEEEKLERERQRQEEEKQRELERKANEEKERLRKTEEEKNRRKPVTKDTKLKDYLDTAFKQGFVEAEDKSVLKGAFLAYQNILNDSSFNFEECITLAHALSDTISAPMDEKQKRIDALEKVRNVLDNDKFKNNTQCMRALVRITEWQQKALNTDPQIVEKLRQEEQNRQKERTQRKEIKPLPPAEFTVKANFPENRDELMNALGNKGWNQEGDTRMLASAVSVYFSYLERVNLYGNRDSEYINTIDDFRSCFNKMTAKKIKSTEERLALADELDTVLSHADSKLYQKRINSAKEEMKTWTDKWTAVAEEERRFKEEPLFGNTKEEFLANAASMGWDANNKEETRVLTRIYRSYKLADELQLSASAGSEMEKYTGKMLPILNRIALRPVKNQDEKAEILRELRSVSEDAYDKTKSQKFSDSLESCIKGIYTLQKTFGGGSLIEPEYKVKVKVEKPKEPEWKAPEAKTPIQFEPRLSFTGILRN